MRCSQGVTFIILAGISCAYAAPPGTDPPYILESPNTRYEADPREPVVFQLQSRILSSVRSEEEQPSLLTEADSHLAESPVNEAQWTGRLSSRDASTPDRLFVPETAISQSSSQDERGGGRAGNSLSGNKESPAAGLSTNKDDRGGGNGGGDVSKAIAPAAAVMGLLVGLCFSSL